MESYGYVAPSSIAEVLAVLNESTSAGQMTQVLAGGSDVLVQMRMPNHQPRTIVDIKKLAETNRLEVSAEGIYIGAAVSSAVMNEHQGLRKAMPGKYQIKAKYFSNRSPELTGGVTLKVDIYTHYGTAREKHQTITVRLKESKDIVDLGSIIME